MFISRRSIQGIVVAGILALFLIIGGAAPLQALPVIVTIKTDTLTVDVDADNFADPGDTVRYTNVVTNTGSTDAGAVVFNDTIDGNTTLVPGSLRTTPIARHDQYASLGNVGISVPPASGVLLNDNDPDGQSVSVIAAAGGTANGGAFSIGSDGAFSYLPPPGFEGTDQFNYSIQDTDGNIDPATVFIVVNEVIWFIDNSQTSSGNGTLFLPFDSISAFNSGAADEAGDTIFLYSGSGNYTSGFTLLNNQILIGQGATASLASIAGLTLPPHTNTLPATGGARPTITTTSGDGVQVAQNNLLRGFNVGNTAGVGISDNGGTVGALTVSEVAITGTGQGFEADNGGTLAVTLDSLNANSGAHGLSLSNTSGSFTVTGTGGANSGGTLSGHSAEGVLLNNVTNISLADMVINQSATSSTQGIDATSVTGLTLVRTTVTAGSGNSYALLGDTIRNWTATNSIFDGGGGSVPNIDGTRITNLLGTNTLTDSTFRNGKDINLLIENNINGGGLDTITISGSSFSNSAGGDHLQVEADGTANLKLVVNASSNGNSTFSGTGQDGMQLEAEGNASFQAVVTQATISGNLGSAVNMGAVANGHMIARVHNLTGLTSSGTNVINMINFDTSTIEATIENNTITSHPVGAGIRVIQEGNGNIITNLADNTISGATQQNGILVQGRAGTVGNGRIDATLDNNVVVNTALNPTTNPDLDGIEVTSGSSAGGDTNTICLNMLDNTSSSETLDGYFLRHRTGSTFQLQDFTGAATSANITNWVNTVKNNTGSVFVSDAAGFTATPSACATPTVPVALAPAGAALVRQAAPDGAQMLMARLLPAGGELPARALAVRETTRVSAFHAPAAGLAQPSVPVAAKPALSGETINISLDLLNPGQVVIITFDVTVDDPQSPVTNGQVCNQGLVSGNNFANVLTDDPDVGGSVAPTCTTLAPGTIIIAKDQSPDGSSSFGFSSNIPGNAAFNVGGDSSVTINNVTPGSYTVTEDDPSASFFALTGLDCDDDASASPSTTDLGTRTATINLESGETVTCTFINEQAGRLEAVKSVNATPNGETFDLLIDGNVEASGVGNGGTTGEVSVTTGNHSVGETGTNLGNYNSSIECVFDGTTTVVASGSGTSLSNIPVNAGDDVLCTITNTHKTGKLEVVKNLEPASDSGSFDMRIDTTAHVATGGDGTTTGEQTVLVGTHLVSETGDGPTNLFDYTVSISCKDNDGTGSEVTTTPSGAFAWDITVNEGDDIVCTITNQRNGTINVVKAATPADDTAFSFSHDIGGGGSFTLQDPSDDTESFSNVTPGSYTISEGTLPGGWSLTDIDCTEDQTANSTENEASAQALVTLDPGETVSCTFDNVFNQPPIIDDGDLSLDDAAIDENDTVTLNGSFVDPDSGDSHTVTIDWGDGSADTTLTFTGGERSFSASHQYLDDNPTATAADDYTISVTVEDDEGESDSASAIVTVRNVAPEVGPILAPAEPVNVNDQPISFTAVFTDPGALDTHTAIWSWGDGNSDTATPTGNTVSAGHTYAEPGVYTIELAVTDDDTGSGSAIYEFVVVYDPSGGFVTGGGWFDSAAGAYRPDPSLSGRATFGFVAKYQRGRQIPDGNAQFQLRVADLNFHSEAYAWLVINQGGTRAQFKGTGLINGSSAPVGDFHFMIWARDEDGGDTFRIKIWYEDAGEIVIYDNDDDQPIGGGSITIHSGGRRK